MALRELAEKDLGFILETDPIGFRWPITLISPEGVTTSGLFGFSDDIAQLIDPDTGVAVSGRLASAAVRLTSIYAAGLQIPRAIADTGSRFWVVQFDDINGLPYRFKVAQSNPDRALGLVTLVLEAAR